ncbi:MAG: hypothetical protein KQI78_10835 [Deltaproteobacteria bacterium]|nr:hypothetical protein [Deltaproteobacteria bacterium]
MSDPCRKSVALPILGQININFYCLSSEVVSLYEKTDEFERQKKIRHLGLISKVFEGASHTRYEYLMLQAGLTDLLDNLHKGSATLSQGDVKIDGKNCMGNGILKTWFLLSNYGHAMNTIGDEKSLLLFSHSQPGFKTNLIAPIRDLKLRQWAIDTIDNFKYVDFHHILSLRRIYKELPRQLDKQNELAKIYKLLLMDANEVGIRVNASKLEQLKKLFKTIRALAIIAIDGHYSHSPITVSLISSIISIETFENTYRGIYLLEQFKPVLSSLHESLYMEKRVLAAQREYEVQSLKYLGNRRKSNSSYENSIQRAMTKGLIDYNECNLKPFFRLKISEKMYEGVSFYEEFKALQNAKNNCEGVEVSLDINPISKMRCADFFINKNEFSPENLPRFVFNISKIIRSKIRYLIDNLSRDLKSLTDEIVDNAVDAGINQKIITDVISNSNKTLASHVWKGFQTEIYPAFKDLFWSILSYFIKDPFQIDIQIPKKEYDIFGMKFPNISLGLSDNINAAINIEKEDKSRAHELNQLLRSVNRSFDGYVLVCLARIVIYNPTKAPNERLVTDIDSCIIKAGKDMAIVELHEAKFLKRNRENRAVKEIRKNIVPVLSNNAKGYRVKKVKGFGGKLVIKCENN